MLLKNVQLKYRSTVYLLGGEQYVKDDIIILPCTCTTDKHGTVSSHAGNII